MLIDIPTLLRSVSLPTTEPPPASDHPRTSTTISIQALPDEPCLSRLVFLSTLLLQTAFHLNFLPTGAAALACALASLKLLPNLRAHVVTLIILILPISKLCIRASLATPTRLTNYWRLYSRPRAVVGPSRAWRAPVRLSQGQ